MTLNHGERLSLEIGSRLEIDVGSPPARLKSRLVGMESGSYLIARLPETAGFGDTLVPGAEVKVRFECSGNLYGFESSVIDFYSRSLPLLILTYPKAVDRHELRTHPRVDCFFPATARMEASEFQGNITDISIGGCRYVSHQMTEQDIHKLTLEKRLVVYIRFPGDELSQAVKGQVRSVRHDGEKAILGLQFEDPEPDLVEKLSDFIDATAFLLK